MREIEFRGFNKGTKKWYSGNLVVLDDTTYCCQDDYNLHPNNTKYYIVFSQMTDWGLPNKHLQVDVDKDSIGQFIGAINNKGQKIYEGDIVIFNDKEYVIKYFSKYARFGLSSNDEMDKLPMLITNLSNVEVIDNAYERRDLYPRGAAL